MTAAPATTATATTAPATAGLLGSLKPAGTAAATPAQDGKAATPAGLTASTMGPASQLPRLKNKTMDEIITRWATDLSKYQKEFKDQASKIAEWDRMLVSNGEKIQKLYTSTYEAERANSEIERQLSNVESQQEELVTWLDRYEQDLNELFAKNAGTSGSGAADQVAGPDQERERTYKLAEKLTDRLDDMGKDLTKMIKEINDMSSSLGKGSKADDPVCFSSPFCLSFWNSRRAMLTFTATVDADCACPERASRAAAVDRHQRCRAPGQGRGGPEGQREHGHQRVEHRDGCGRELLPVVPGRVQMRAPRGGDEVPGSCWLLGCHNVMVMGWDYCMYVYKTGRRTKTTMSADRPEQEITESESGSLGGLERRLGVCTGTSDVVDPPSPRSRSRQEKGSQWLITQRQ
jgi:hypothetical protein